ncbi:Phospholipase A2 protein [Rutstroemia sp. NJR-2017a BVV2]|nr:Phospholipase A2 protein [Rutstroemia sp. NJR-2017a BVV2]
MGALSNPSTMKFFLPALSFLGSSIAFSITTDSPTTAPGCNADNCYRAISGDFRGPLQQATAYNDCVSYMSGLSPTEIISVTITQTVLTTITVASTVAKRTAAATAFTLPAYASACSGEARYSSACSCWGIHPTTVCSTTTLTSTLTHTTTSTLTPCPSGPALLTDPSNCGSCGHVCASGICEHGTCNRGPCTPFPCSEGIQPCTSDATCFCFYNIAFEGFCGENRSCDQALACTDDFDCPGAEVCAWETCCGGPVCVRGDCGNPAGVLFGEREREELAGDTLAWKAEG